MLTKPTASRSSRWLDAVWLIVLAVYILAGVRLVPFHGDESTLLYMSRDFYTQFVDGDFAALDYRAWFLLDPEAASQQQLRLLNGTVTKSLYGLVAHLSGYEIDDINNQWVWGADWDWNRDNGHMPTDDLLLRARLVSALMLVGSVLVLYAIAYQIGGRLTAVLASAYYALNPAILINGRRAMMEGSLLLFSLLVVWAGLLVLRDRRPWQYGLLGLVSGLALASKHTAAVTLVAIFGGIALIDLWQLRPEFRPAHLIRRWGALLAAGLLALAVFLALNPAWWSDPLGRINTVLDERVRLLTGQIAAFGGYSDATDQLAGFLRQTLIVTPMYSEVDFFLAYIPDQIATYEASPWRGVSLGGSLPGAAIMVGLMLFGSAALWRQRSKSAALIGFWAVPTLLFVWLATPLEWQRYYLIAYPVLGLLAAFGLAHLLHSLMPRVMQRRGAARS